MIPSAFEYVAPSSLAEATAFLAAHPDDAKLVAGGHSLIPLMKLRLAAPKYLVDLAHVPGLKGVKEVGGAIEIGALTTHYEVQSSSVIRERLPVLAETAATIGDVQVRNRGTIGGSLAHADPAADYPATILALDAEIEVSGRKGLRSIKAADFFVDLLTTSLNADEVVTKIRIPLPLPGTGAAYEKFPHPASRYAIVGVAAVVHLNANGTCASAAIGVTGAGAKPERAAAAERGLVGSQLDDAALQKAGVSAAEAIDPVGDIHASAEYRRHLVREFTVRALRAAAERAKK
ncbi:MAG TPA: xanthine dehydrogenase family protein subunit M [Chloroflexota bacterium]|nr:xanthine dehydrogenase family protein subunit M [Chloroflexota bacterium]